jgi:hypothetical protein
MLRKAMEGTRIVHVRTRHRYERNMKMDGSNKGRIEQPGKASDWTARIAETLQEGLLGNHGIKQRKI